MRLAVFVGYHYCELAPSANNRVKNKGGMGRWPCASVLNARSEDWGDAIVSSRTTKATIARSADRHGLFGA
jgi:hypothetical protein